MQVPIHQHSTETIKSLLETCSRAEALEHLKIIFTPALFKKNKKEFGAWAGLFLNKILDPYDFDNGNSCHQSALNDGNDIDFYKTSVDSIITLLRVSDFKSVTARMEAEGYIQQAYFLTNTQFLDMPEYKAKLLNLISASCLVEEFRETPDSALWKYYTFVEVIPHIPRITEDLHVRSHLHTESIQEMLKTIVHQLEMGDLSDDQMLQASYVLSLRDLKSIGDRLDPVLLDRIKLVASKVFNPDTLELLLSLGPLDKYAKWCMLDTKYRHTKVEPIPFEI